MQTDQSSPDVLILGAGLAGLGAARVLQAAGRRVLVVDKSRGVSGRASTRRWDDVPVDHGAQFFTARSPEFKALVADWEARGVCFDWARGFHQLEENGTLRPPDPEEARHPRYACRAGMSALGKDLAAGLPTELNRRAVALHGAGGDGWRVEFEDGGEARTGRALLLAMPIPQARALLEGSSVVDPAALAPLRAVDIGPTLAVLRKLPAEGPAPEDWRGIQAPGAGQVVSWIGADWSKRLSAGERTRVYVLHGGREFSREFVDGDLAEAGRRMVTRAAEIVGPWMADGRGETQVHRWRYAVVRRGFDATGETACHEVPTRGGRLILAGDAFCGAKVEGAWRSGQAAAARLLAGKG